MTAISGTQIIAPVVPPDTTSTHPSHIAEYGKGGYRTEATTAARDAIPAARRTEGMLVYVVADSTAYKLGANLTTWTEHGAQWVKRGTLTLNAKDYGAIGNGTTDDSAAIQSAIDVAAANAYGGKVFIPAGIYIINATLLLKTRVYLQGDSMRTTRLRAKAGLNAAVIGVPDLEQYWYGISDLTVDGNRTNQTAGHGIWLPSAQPLTNVDDIDGPNSEFKNLWVEECFGDCYRLGDYGMGGHSFFNCTAYKGWLSGFNIRCPDSYFFNCVSAFTKSYGFEIRSANNFFGGCKVFLAGKDQPSQGDGYYIRAPRNQFQGCIAQDCFRYGMHIYQGHRTFVANLTADTNNYNEYAYGSGVFINDSDSCSISGVSYNRTGYTHQKYGISIGNAGAGVTNCDISLICTDNTTGTILNDYADFYIRNRFFALGQEIIRSEIGPLTVASATAAPSPPANGVSISAGTIRIARTANAGSDELVRGDDTRLGTGGGADLDSIVIDVATSAVVLDLVNATVVHG